MIQRSKEEIGLLSLLKQHNITSCQRASIAKTGGLRGGQLYAARSIAAVRKIFDRAVKSVTKGCVVFNNYSPKAK